MKPEPVYQANITPMQKHFMNSITPLSQKQNGDGTYYINNITNNIIQMDKQKIRD
jgi:hypothetical protein